MATTLDRRRCLRLPVKLPVIVSSYRGKTAGVIARDLSMRGCALEADAMERLSEGAKVRVRLHVPGEEQAITVEVAVVRAVDTPRMSLEFLDISPTEKNRLGQLVFQLWKAHSQSLTANGKETAHVLSERVH